MRGSFVLRGSKQGRGQAREQVRPIYGTEQYNNDSNNNTKKKELDGDVVNLVIVTPMLKHSLGDKHA